MFALFAQKNLVQEIKGNHFIHCPQVDPIHSLSLLLFLSHAVMVAVAVSGRCDVSSRRPAALFLSASYIGKRPQGFQSHIAYFTTNVVRTNRQPPISSPSSEKRR